MCSRYISFLNLKEPAFKTLHFELFSFNPDTFSNSSSTNIRVSKDFFLPSVIKVASSAKSVRFTSTLFTQLKNFVSVIY